MKTLWRVPSARSMIPMNCPCNVIAAPERNARPTRRAEFTFDSWVVKRRKVGGAAPALGRPLLAVGPRLRLDVDCAASRSVQRFEEVMSASMNFPVFLAH